MLSFEHTIVVNGPAGSAEKALSRDELWAGLVYRARRPDHFNPALNCRIEDVDECRFVRYIRAGDLELRDEVTLLPSTEVRTLIDGADQPLYAESSALIQEADDGGLHVVFRYRRDSLNEAGGMDADEFLKSAYRQLDHDAIALIRQMAAEGWSRTLM